MAWKYKIVELNDGGPPAYRIFDESDDSYEATICELWSGEHDNKVIAEKIISIPELEAENARLKAENKKMRSDYEYLQKFAKLARENEG